jgi:hypothetical protein
MQERRISLKYVQIISVSIGTYFKKIGIVDKKKLVPAPASNQLTQERAFTEIEKFPATKDILCEPKPRVLAVFHMVYFHLNF